MVDNLKVSQPCIRSEKKINRVDLFICGLVAGFSSKRAFPNDVQCDVSMKDCLGISPSSWVVIDMVQLG